MLEGRTSHRMAESFGARATRATSPDEVTAAIADAFGHAGPSAIEVPVGVMPDPWDWIVGKRIRPRPRSTNDPRYQPAIQPPSTMRLIPVM